jgi:hypothetical protein
MKGRDGTGVPGDPNYTELAKILKYYNDSKNNEYVFELNAAKQGDSPKYPKIKDIMEQNKTMENMILNY